MLRIPRPCATIPAKGNSTELCTNYVNSFGDIKMFFISLSASALKALVSQGFPKALGNYWKMNDLDDAPMTETQSKHTVKQPPLVVYSGIEINSAFRASIDSRKIREIRK